MMNSQELKQNTVLTSQVTAFGNFVYLSKFGEERIKKGGKKQKQCVQNKQIVREREKEREGSGLQREGGLRERGRERVKRKG